MQYRNIFIALISIILLSSCSPKTSDKLVAASNLKKLGIDDKNLHSIDSLLGAALINNWAAGVTAIVTKDAQVVYYKGLGFRNRETKALMMPMDLFRIASMTKPVVSVAAMQLVEQGKLKLEDPVSKFIPEFKNVQVLDQFNEEDTTYTTVPAQKEITVRHLLTHTSGIGYSFTDKKLGMLYKKHNIPDLATTENIVLDSVMRELAKLPLGIQPGTQFYYGLSTDVLGRVLEVAGQKPLDSLLIKNIFEPLRMSNTHFFLPPQKINRLSTMYSETKEGRLVRTPSTQGRNTINFATSGAKTYLSGGSGLISNLDDYAKFLQMILNKGSYGGKTILKPESIDTMTVNQIGNISLQNGNKFGLGFEITTEQGIENNSKIGKLSWSGAFNTTFWIDPQRNATAILMTQVYPAIHKKELYSKFETLVNRALDEEPQKK